MLIYKDGKGNFGMIDDIACESTIEKGPIYHRIHLHALLQFKHRTKIHLDVKKMREFFAKELQLSSFHLNVRFAPGLMNLKEYIRKNPIAE